MTTKDDGVLRGFDSGATRDTAEGKLDYEGFLSPFVLRQYARYMNMNRLQSDGQLRDSDNWQAGIPMSVYMKSLTRHYHEMWQTYRTQKDSGLPMPRDVVIEFVAAICGQMFNSMGYMLELLKENEEVRFDDDEPTVEMKARQDNIAHETGVTIDFKTATESTTLLDNANSALAATINSVSEPYLEAMAKFNMADDSQMDFDDELNDDVDDPIQEEADDCACIYCDEPVYRCNCPDDPYPDSAPLLATIFTGLNDTISKIREQITLENNPLLMLIPGEPEEEDACTELDTELDDMMSVENDMMDCSTCRYGMKPGMPSQVCSDCLVQENLKGLPFTLWMGVPK